MARWHRDVKTWKRVMFSVGLVDGLALSANFFFIFRHYLWWTSLNIIPSWKETAVPFVVPLVLTGLSLVVVAYQAVVYAAGRAWARWLFIAENLVLLSAGLLWFLLSVGNPIGPQGPPVVHGLLVPMVTLFPLLWPLGSLRPRKPPEAG